MTPALAGSGAEEPAGGQFALRKGGWACEGGPAIKLQPRRSRTGQVVGEGRGSRYRRRAKPTTLRGRGRRGMVRTGGEALAADLQARDGGSRKSVRIGTRGRVAAPHLGIGKN